MKRFITIVALVALAVGCADPESTGTPSDAAQPDATGPDSEIDVGIEPIEEERTGRVPTRMTIDQLARSIPIITGGIRWVEDFGDGPLDLLQLLAPTLGAPDYTLVTEENQEPSLIIAKFMADAAARICTRWVDQDKAAAMVDRTLVTHEDWASTDRALVQSNLRRLILRMHGRYVTPDDYAGIADQYTLFEAASGAAPAGFEAHDGWLAVCLGLMTDPEILVY
ncbi:MAG: hypothetical protein ACI9OJ_002375 [Myxococcota bacterium]|jgi:hypothetical protein